MIEKIESIIERMDRIDVLVADSFCLGGLTTDDLGRGMISPNSDNCERVVDGCYQEGCAENTRRDAEQVEY